MNMSDTESTIPDEEPKDEHPGEPPVVQDQTAPAYPAVTPGPDADEQKTDEDELDF